MSEFREKLNAAFDMLRGRGLVAEGNCECCRTCAGYALTQRAVEMVKTGTPQPEILGCVFWHGQDDEDLDDSGEVFLAYGPLVSTEFGIIGLPTKGVGNLVVKALEEVGLRAVWDGDGNKRILAALRSEREVSHV
jgi:hypothetical protein